MGMTASGRRQQAASTRQDRVSITPAKTTKLSGKSPTTSSGYGSHTKASK